jgi:23S rRNA (uracil1939-C5)-methyltransferase
MIKKGDEISVDVIELSSEGKGISKLEDGFVIFTSEALPGDRVLIRIVRKKSKYAEASLVKLINNSPFRVSPKCSYFGTCGGCKIQNYTYEKQIEYKTQVVFDAFQRIGGFKEISVPVAIANDDIFFYRNKMEFSFSDDEWTDLPPNKDIANEENKSNPEVIPSALSLQGGNNDDTKNANLQYNPPYKGGQGGLYFDNEWLRKRNLILGGYHLPYNPKLVARAKEFRKNPTEYEKKIWYDFLRNLDIRFLRQRPIDNFIVDFYCSHVRLVIEIDGGQHEKDDSMEYDHERTEILENVYGLKILRFPNNDIKNNFEQVCKKIQFEIEQRQGEIPPSPPFQGGSSTDKKKDDLLYTPPYKGGQGGLLRFALGLHVPKFHSKIVDIKECFLQSELSNGILNFTRDFFKSKNIPVYSTKTQSGFLRFLIIRQSKNTKDVMVNLITYDHDETLMNEYCKDLVQKFPEITTVINSVSNKKAQVATGEKENVLFGNGFITEKLISSSGNEYIFELSPQSFFQTNTLQAQKLFDTAVSFGDFNKDDTVLDLYCGAGVISIFISGRVKKVLGVELSEDAIRDARKNAGINKVSNTEFITSDIKDFLESESISEFNKLILDPPRAGLHPKICEILSDTNFEKIIYISCNPHTQARDLQIICGKGKYLIEKIQPVDMFPHTFHIENVVSLVRC